MSARIQHVEGKIIFTDGKEVEFLIGPSGSSRWGEIRATLAEAVEPCEAMNRALAPYFQTEPTTEGASS